MSIRAQSPSRKLGVDRSLPAYNYMGVRKNTRRKVIGTKVFSHAGNLGPVRSVSLRAKRSNLIGGFPFLNSDPCRAGVHGALSDHIGVSI